MKHSINNKITVRKAAVFAVLFITAVSGTALHAVDTDGEGADEYTNAEAAALPEGADEYAEEGNEKTDKDKKAKKKGNPRKQGIFKFIYGNGRYIEYDETRLYTANPLGKLVLVPGTIIIYPKTGEAGIKTRFQATYYAILFNDQMRHRIFGAVDQYLDDFANKKLKRKNKKSYAEYGRGKAYINYGTLAMMMAAEGKPDIQIGYKFKGKSPYFTITVRSTPNIDPNKGQNDVKDSVEFILYFTKAQASAFCSLLRDEIVEAALVEELEEVEGSGDTTTGDEYDE